MNKSVYRHIKDIWQYIPADTRTYLRRSWVVRQLVLGISDVLINTASHQEIYDESYYRQVNHASAKSASTIANSLIQHLQPKRFLDIGCGGGAILSALSRKGIDCVGIEYSEKGIAMARKKGLCVYQYDIESGASRPNIGNFDVASCFEVAEHIPKQFSGKLIDLITTYSDVVVFSAATPGQGGMDHVNEQPHEYWISMFAANQYFLDESLTRRLRIEWDTKVASWYSLNVMIFKKQ
jgi:SAM-dependent methyltransferase